MDNPLASLLLGLLLILGLGTAVVVALIVDDEEEGQFAQPDSVVEGGSQGPPGPQLEPESRSVGPAALEALKREMEKSDAEIARLRAEIAKLTSPDEERAAELAALREPLAWLRRLDPKSFDDMPVETARHLREIDLTGLDVTDEDLAHLVHFKNLKELQLRKTKVTDEGLRHVRNLDKLRSLGLRETKITDEGMAIIRDMPLEWLDVNMTAVGNEGVKHIRDMTTLAFLRLNYTRITDEGLAHLGRLDKLVRLDLWGTKISESPPYLDGLEALDHLELGATAVSKEWVEEFQRAHPDCYVRSRWGR